MVTVRIAYNWRDYCTPVCEYLLSSDAARSVVDELSSEVPFGAVKFIEFRTSDGVYRVKPRVV